MKRLGRPWSHPVVLNTEPLYWESGALTARPLLHKHSAIASSISVAHSKLVNICSKELFFNLFISRLSSNKLDLFCFQGNLECFEKYHGGFLTNFMPLVSFHTLENMRNPVILRGFFVFGGYRKRPIALNGLNIFLTFFRHCKIPS